MHVNHLGLRTDKDWELMKVIAADDWVLVTNNVIEFRGRYRKVDLHPGVVFLVPSVRGLEQLRLFHAALDYVDAAGDLVNRALDIAVLPDGSVAVEPYDLP